MHENNRRWLTDLRAQFPAAFSGARVLEIGAKIWEPAPHDSIREFFEGGTYVGVDREFGEGVDLVVEANATAFREGEFDTLAMFSLFEHDPDWRGTLTHNLRWLRPGGLFLTCFGAEGNLPHLMRWQIVPHREFLDFCGTLPLRVLDAFFEEARYGQDCRGAYDVVAEKLPADIIDDGR